MKTAVAYLRVSGKGQINGNGFQRQEEIIREYAERNGYEVVRVYKEKGVSGTMEKRPALTDLITDLENENHTVLIERLDRLARKGNVQETIVDLIRSKDRDIISIDIDQKLGGDDESKILIQQIMGSISQYDKSVIVKKLKHARDRKRVLTGKCEGRKSYQESSPELITEIKRLRRKPKNGKCISLKKTVDTLNDSGFKTATGKAFTVPTLKHIIYTCMKRN